MFSAWSGRRLLLALLLVSLSLPATADERPAITPERLKLLADDVRIGTQGLRVKAARELALVGPGTDRPSLLSAARSRPKMGKSGWKRPWLSCRSTRARARTP